MTETAKAPPGPPVLQHIDFPNLLFSLNHYAEPADRALDAAVSANAEGDDLQTALKTTVHFDAILAWVRENPEEAARIALAAVYVRNGRFLVQVPAPAPAAPQDAAPESQPPQEAQEAPSEG